jgi:IclR family KDG regulon transcriptional repressor
MNKVTMTSTQKQSIIFSAQKLIDILEIIAEAKSSKTVNDVVDICGMSRPNAYRYLMTLQNNGYVLQNDDGSYHLGPKLLYLAKQYLNQFNWLQAAQDIMKELSQTSNETVHMGILDETEIVYMARVDSPQSIRMFSEIGSRNPVHCTAMGKALLAFMDNNLRESILSQIDLEPKTKNTITDVNELRNELEIIKKNGYAIDDIENEDGVRCIGTVINNAYGQAVCALSISGPAFRLNLENLKDLSVPLMDAAKRISQVYEHQAMN